MTEPDIAQLRSFRLHSHHLDGIFEPSDIPAIAGACALQNSPPGAWENALFHRISSCHPTDLNRLLCEEKILLQSWSLRGLPAVFPSSESSTFLSALIPQEGEPWIYTDGIRLALHFLHMSFEELLKRVLQVMPRLNDVVITSKNTLDQTIAGWVCPLLPASRQELWNQPSMYGQPDQQTVGGAVVSFLLRPCAFLGLVVFGERTGISPTFTSFENFTGHPLTPDPDACKRLVRKYLHCYGPATPDSFASWLGCSGMQARRMWESVSEEMEPAAVLGRKAFFLSADKERLFSSPTFDRELLLISGHDPYLDQRDRLVLQSDKTLHRQIWKTVSNPGAVIYQGEIAGIWTPRKKNAGIDIQMTLFHPLADRRKLAEMAEMYASFRGEKLLRFHIND